MGLTDLNALSGRGAAATATIGAATATIITTSIIIAIIKWI